MVVGTGIDIIEVDRIALAAKKQTFLNRVFTGNEQAYYESCGFNAQTLAGTFAAKEAAAKALAAGFNGISLRDIEIVHEESGKPMVRLHATAQQRMKDLGGSNLHVSISHIKALAVAQAILED